MTTHPAPFSETYAALDGSTVAIPAPRPLEDGPMPVFDDSDRVWLGALIDFRDRANAHDAALPPPPADLEQIDPDTRRMLQSVTAQQTQHRNDLTAKNDAKRAAADAEFGVDGAGFLDQLNDGRALASFWQTLNRLLCQRIPVMEYCAPEEQKIIADLLARFPEKIRLPILAEVCWPTTEHRKWEHVAALMADYIARPDADFRHLETGSAKPDREDDLPDAVRGAMLREGLHLLQSYEAFKGTIIAADDVPEDAAETVQRSQDTAAILRSFEKGEGTPTQTRAAENLIRDLKPARSAEQGMTQGEINLFKFHGAAGATNAVAPGRDEGYFMRLALSAMPGGFRRMGLARHPRQIVWPYIASHFDILDRAFGLSKPFLIDPTFERKKAVALLKLLPKGPARYGDALFEIATGTAKGGRADAQALLHGATQYTGRAVALLDGKTVNTREQAAHTLAAIGDPAALAPLRARLKVESAKRVIGAINDAIGVLGSADEGAPNLADILAEFAAGKEILTTKTKWLKSRTPPALTLSDQSPAPEGFALWLLTLATRHGSPEGAVYVDHRLSALTPETRTTFANWVIGDWATYDAQPYPPDRLAENWQVAFNESYYGYRAFWKLKDCDHHCNNPEYQREKPFSAEEWADFAHDRIAKRAQMFINWKPYLFNALPAKGVLAIARHASADVLCDTVTDYLTNHSRRKAQCKALLDCLAASDDPAARAALTSMAADQGLKSLRTYAADLLRAA